MLRLDSLRALAGVYPGVEREDEMVAAFDFCAFGKGGAAPSIDTAMHGLVEAAHVDHLHPDAGIAFATAADGEKLTRECFGGRVAWVPWRRPGFQLGLDIAAVQRERPEAIGVILGGHGITAWGGTSEECQARSLEIIAAAQKFIDERGAPRRSGGWWQSRCRRPSGGRGPRPWPRLIRGLASTDRPQLGHFTDTAAVLEFARQRADAAAGGARHLLPRPLPAHQGRARWSWTCRRTAPIDAVIGRLRELHAAYRADYAGLLRAARDPGLARRCAAPTRRSCWCPGVGMFSYGADKQTARVAGEFYLNAINVMRGAEAISTTPRSARARSSGSSTGSWRRPSSGAAPPQAAGGADRAGHRRRLRDRPGDRPAAGGRGRLRGGRRPRRAGGGDGRRRARAGRRRGGGPRPT